MSDLLIFNNKYFSEPEIWAIIHDIIKERDEIQALLATASIGADLDQIPRLAKRLHELNYICANIDQLKNCLKDLQELQQMLNIQQQHPDNDQQQQEDAHLYAEYLLLCTNTARQLYQLLLEKGYLDLEREDATDLAILKFINYAGPEYAWRLGINIGIEVAEARERLEILLKKNLLAKVSGTMLKNYHRSKDWTKHMNHTYYQITRKGRLYLRALQQDQT
ncbi:MAG: DUF2250 domain-containing protein [Desulfotomaculum sp.]|nr:DUF2250 domain-containing protein [Desulfotomaculum sp.]